MHDYWQKYLQLKQDVPVMPALRGSVPVNLAAMSTVFYQELTARGQNEEITTQLFYEIACKVYNKMERFSWWLTKLGKRNGYSRLFKATQLFRVFPYNSPSYQREDVQTGDNIVGFYCTNIHPA